MGSGLGLEKMRLGAHVPISGGLYKGFSNGQKLGCDAIQIFVKNPNQWVGKLPTDIDIQKFRQVQQDSPIQEVIVHDIHLTNLAGPKAETLEKSRQTFALQVNLLQQMGITYLVTHLGSHLGTGEEEGQKRKEKKNEKTKKIRRK